MYKNLFKQTAIYGIATVLPRMLSFILVRLYTDTSILPSKSDYGDLTIVMSWMVLFNVILSYGFETSFFRFYTKEDNKERVLSTSMTSIVLSSVLFLILSLLFKHDLAEYADIKVEYIVYSIWILFLDALTVIPFSILRVKQRPVLFAIIKIGNITLNLFLNFFFLVYLPKSADSFLSIIYVPNFQLSYILLSNLIASLVTLLIFVPDYFRMNWFVEKRLWKSMINYGLPILFAGIAFSINEHFDKILLAKLLPSDTAKSDVGVYSACYKLGLFMVLFRSAFTLGIEPFFFSHAKNEKATEIYATITKYFIIFGSLISLSIIVFADVLKVLLLDNKAYWDAMDIVPLIVFANFFLGIYTNLSIWYKLTDKTIYGAYISIVGAFITLIFNFLLIPYFSYYGSALATITAYSCMMVISYYYGKKKYPIPYDMKQILEFLSLSILLSILCFYIPAIRENYYIKVSLLIGFIYYSYIKCLPIKSKEKQ